MVSHGDDEEASGVENEKLLIEAIEAKMSHMMDEKLEAFRGERTPADPNQNPERTEQEPRDDDAARSYYIHSSRSQRRRRCKKDKPFRCRYDRHSRVGKG
ncbi:unnamed protein product [Arabis nemorensis]|uniref:Uncharacterized protein n=1 Tax=Arabis nemorensis TaxID=586526 RepID=A0A565CKD9_9BRAS|nr:unnamed protein product [Arabis nemorensis]